MRVVYQHCAYFSTWCEILDFAFGVRNVDPSVGQSAAFYLIKCVNWCNAFQILVYTLRLEFSRSPPLGYCLVLAGEFPPTSYRSLPRVLPFFFLGQCLKYCL